MPVRDSLIEPSSQTWASGSGTMDRKESSELDYGSIGSSQVVVGGVVGVGGRVAAANSNGTLNNDGTNNHNGGIGGGGGANDIPVNVTAADDDDDDQTPTSLLPCLLSIKACCKKKAPCGLEDTFWVLALIAIITFAVLKAATPLPWGLWGKYVCGTLATLALLYTVIASFNKFVLEDRTNSHWNAHARFTQAVADRTRDEDQRVHVIAPPKMGGAKLNIIYTVGEGSLTTANALGGGGGGGGGGRGVSTRHPSSGSLGLTGVCATGGSSTGSATPTTAGAVGVANATATATAAALIAPAALSVALGAASSSSSSSAALSATTTATAQLSSPAKTGGGHVLGGVASSSHASHSSTVRSGSSGGGGGGGSGGSGGGSGTVLTQVQTHHDPSSLLTQVHCVKDSQGKSALPETIAEESESVDRIESPCDPSESADHSQHQRLLPHSNS